MDLKKRLILGLCLIVFQSARPDYTPENFSAIVLGAPLAAGALAYVAWAPGGQWVRDLPNTLSAGLEKNPVAWTVGFTTLLAASLVYKYRENKKRVELTNQKIVAYLKATPQNDKPNHALEQQTASSFLIDGKINPEKIDDIHTTIYKALHISAEKPKISKKDLELWKEYQQSGSFSHIGTLLSQ